MDQRTKYLILGITLGVILILAIILIVEGDIFTTGGVINVQNENCKEIEIPYEELEEYVETVPYTDQECEYEVLVYSITDFNLQSKCLDYDERCLDYILGICVEKETFCVEKSANFGLNLNNFDDERGTWSIKFILYGDNSVMNSKTQNVFLYPRGSEGIYWTFTILGEEDCKKEITGNYIVENEPEKQICKDVTKYESVTKTRTITKYKTKTVCE